MPYLLEGSRIKSLRESRKLTQHDLASSLRRAGFGTTQTTVSRWEAGQSPHSSVIPALAEALGVEVAELYGADDEDEDAALSRETDMLRALRDQLTLALGERAVA